MKNKITSDDPYDYPEIEFETATQVLVWIILKEIDEDFYDKEFYCVSGQKLNTKTEQWSRAFVGNLELKLLINVY